MCLVLRITIWQRLTGSCLCRVGSDRHLSGVCVGEAQGTMGALRAALGPL